MCFMLLETEKVHARARRYLSPEETAFFPQQLEMSPVLEPLEYPQVLQGEREININDVVMKVLEIENRNTKHEQIDQQPLPLPRFLQSTVGCSTSSRRAPVGKARSCTRPARSCRAIPPRRCEHSMASRTGCVMSRLPVAPKSSAASPHWTPSWMETVHVRDPGRRSRPGRDRS